MSRNSFTGGKKFPKCHLLLPKENHLMSQLVGVAVEVIVSSVVQIFETYPPRHDWIKIGCGVLCYVKDYVEQSFFLRLFCLKRRTQIWEQEIYKNIEYIAGKSFFHMFEGDNGIIGINFADLQGASQFYDVLNSGKNIKPAATVIEKSKKKGKKKLSKLDIGTPHQFVHVSHVGFDNSFNMDPKFESVLKEVGISEILKTANKTTRKRIYEIIEETQKEVKQIRRKAKRQAPPPPGISKNSGSNPPMPPKIPPLGRKGNNVPNKPPRVHQNIPPPPPQLTGNIPPPPPPIGNIPPPPPPTTTANIPPPPPILNLSTSPPHQIPSQTPNQINNNLDARSALLQSIEQGIKLKSVSERDISQKSDVVDRSDLGAALLSALLKREKVFSGDDESSDDSSEWEDD